MSPGGARNEADEGSGAALGRRWVYSDRTVLSALGHSDAFALSWPDQPLVSRTTASLFQDAFAWSSIDRVLSSHNLRIPDFRLVRDGAVIPLQAVTRPDRATSQGIQGLADPVRIEHEVSNGATLVLQGVQRFWQPVGDLARRLSAEVGHGIFVNAYMTGVSAQGFPAHHDPYHAWLVQVGGAKEWKLWPPGVDPAVDAPFAVFVLEEGDTLWVPRGWVHAGATAHRASLHLTVTVWATTVGDMLRVLVAHLADRVDVNKEMPPNSLVDHELTAGAFGELQSEVARTVTEASSAELGIKLLQDRLDRFDPLPALPIVKHGVRDERCLHLHPEAVVHMRRTSDEVVVTTPDSVIRIPGAFAEQVLAVIRGRADAEQIYPRLTGVPSSLVSDVESARIICCDSSCVRPAEAH